DASSDARRWRDGGGRSWSGLEIQVPRDSGAVLAERVSQQPNSTSGLGQVVVVEIDVEQVDVPRQLDVGQDDLPSDWQRGVLRDVVDVSIARAPQFLVLLGEQAQEQRGGEWIPPL